MKKNKKIILTGYMGAGKSTIGKMLSQISNIPFYDLDAIIEQKHHKTVSQIFQENGEITFRKYEHESLHEFINKNESYILGLGGGTPCYANNHLILESDNIISIYLKASVSELKNRLEKEKDHRPILKNVDDLYSYIGPHLLERSYYYHFSKHQVHVDNKKPEEIVTELLHLIR